MVNPGGQEAQTARLVGWDSKDFESLCEVSDTNYVTNDVAAEETSMTSGKVPVFSMAHLKRWRWLRFSLLDLIPNCVVQVVTAHECRELIKEADDDGDKRISFSEFLDMMKGTSKKKDKGDKGGRAQPIDVDDKRRLRFRWSVAEGRRELFKRIFKKRLK